MLDELVKSRSLVFKHPLIVNNNPFAGTKVSGNRFFLGVNQVPVEGRIVEPELPLLCFGKFSGIAVKGFRI